MRSASLAVLAGASAALVACAQRAQFSPESLGASTTSTGTAGAGSTTSTSDGGGGSGGVTTSEPTADEPLCLWSKGFFDPNWLWPQWISTNADGEILCVGGFTTSIDFGGGALESTDGSSGYAAMMSADGEHIWSRTIPSNANLTPPVHTAGGPFLIGGLTGSFVLDGTSIDAQGTEAGFILKLDSTGKLDWGRTLIAVEGAPSSQAAAIAGVNAPGGVVLAGGFAGTIDLGGGPVSSTAGTVDAFLLQLDPLGAHVWSRTFGGDGTQQAPPAVAADDKGNLVLVGPLADPVDFGGGTLSGDIEPGYESIVVAKLGPEGEHLWSRAFHDVSLSDVAGAAVDPAGNVYLTGSFNWNAAPDFGGGPLDGYGGASDIFLVKLGPNGDHLWSRSFGDAKAQIPPAGIVADQNGNVFVAGQLAGQMSFGGKTLAGVAGSDMYLAKLGPDGEHLWSTQLGGVAGLIANGIRTDSAGNLLLAGTLTGQADFGCGPLVGMAGGFFLAKLSAAAMTEK